MLGRQRLAHMQTQCMVRAKRKDQSERILQPMGCCLTFTLCQAHADHKLSGQRLTTYKRHCD